MRTLLLFLLTLLSLHGDTLSYLNELRQKSGLIALKSNALLNKSAHNHARYLDRYNEGGHYEQNSAVFSTGRGINDRARYVGYKGGIIENVSVSPTAKDSIDDLFGAIYHRFSFLNFHIDEVGMASYYKHRTNKLHSYVYNIGNSKIAELCSGKPYQGYGKIYSSVCSEASFKINESDFLNTHYYHAKNNPPFVLFPYDGMDDVPPAFYEEEPDPLPYCKVSGYPVSIEFNPAFYKNVTLISFRLLDEHHNEIKAKRTLTQKSDPNRKLNAYQFAFMPHKRLSFDSKYHAKVRYQADGKEQIKEWSFRTQKPKHTLLELTKSNQRLIIESGKEYWIYLKPKNCKDVYNQINSSFPENMTIKHHFINSNILYFKVIGRSGDLIKCRLNRGKKFQLEIR